MRLSRPRLKSRRPVEATPSRAELERRLSQLLAEGGKAQVAAEPLLRLMRCEPEDADEVTHAIESCPVLTSRLLGVINSAAFALPRVIDTVRRAVLQLGPARARALALAFALRVLHEGMTLPMPMVHHLWVNSLRKACAARLACQLLRPDDTDQAFCHGLLQDVGLPMLIAVDLPFYEHGIQTAGHRGTWSEQEAAHFGLDHAQVGERLLRQWGVPAAISEAVAAHHRPPLDESSDRLPLRMCCFLSSLIPHFAEPASGYEREWLAALHGQVLAEHYASPDAFLAAAAVAARQIHGEGAPPPIDAAIVRQLHQVVSDNTATLVQNLCELENSLGAAQKQTHALRFAAYTDPLTRVLNRRGFHELGDRRVEMAGAQNRGVLVISVDVDNFKQVNDTYGHDAGDRLLRSLAQLMRDNLDREDLIGRIGGDEFVILVVGVDEPRARAITERLNNTCNGADLEFDGGRRIPLSFSLGAVFCRQLGDAPSLDDLLNAADETMYRRKHGGKAGFVFVNY